MQLQHPLTIRTSRLVIRLSQVRDAQAYVELLSNPINSQFEPHKPVNPTVMKYESRIRHWREEAATRKNCFMVIALCSTLGQEGVLVGEELENEDEIVGMCSFNALFNQHDPVTGKDRLVCDAGVMIDSAHTRKGYAREALTAIINHAFSAMDCDLVQFETLATNTPFRGLMDRMGLDELGTETYDASIGEGRLYQITNKDWISAQP